MDHSESVVVRTETAESSVEERWSEIAGGFGEEGDSGFGGRWCFGSAGGRFGGDGRGREGKDDADVWGGGTERVKR